MPDVPVGTFCRLMDWGPTIKVRTIRNRGCVYRLHLRYCHSRARSSPLISIWCPSTQRYPSSSEQRARRESRPNHTSANFAIAVASRASSRWSITRSSFIPTWCIWTMPASRGWHSTIRRSRLASRRIRQLYRSCARAPSSTAMPACITA